MANLLCAPLREDGSLATEARLDNRCASFTEQEKHMTRANSCKVCLRVLNSGFLEQAEHMASHAKVGSCDGPGSVSCGEAVHDRLQYCLCLFLR